MKVVSLFTGAGGLDLGFKKAGFDIIWANEFDSTIWETFEKNFSKTKMDKRSIVDVPTADVPFADGIIVTVMLPSSRALFTRSRNTPSAMGERQILPMQTNSTLTIDDSS